MRSEQWYDSTVPAPCRASAVSRHTCSRIETIAATAAAASPAAQDALAQHNERLWQDAAAGDRFTHPLYGHHMLGAPSTNAGATRPQPSSAVLHLTSSLAREGMTRNPTSRPTTAAIAMPSSTSHTAPTHMLPTVGYRVDRQAMMP